MQQRLKSMLIGAAVAAALTLPAAAADNGWVTWPAKTYDVRTIKIDDLVGTLRIEVRDGGPVTLNVSGAKTRVDDLEVKNSGSMLRISGNEDDESVWDWKNWFNFSSHNDDGQLNVKLVVPRGADINVDGLVGDATIGDTQGPLKFDAVSTSTTIGRVGQAKLSLAGSGKINYAQVNGDLKLDIAGSGKITGGNVAGYTKAEIAGSGSAQIGTVNGGIDIDIAGSGDFAAAKVNGPVKVDIAGAGNVQIGDGVANPLHVDIMGSGDFTFGGLAVDPDIDALGSGNVRLRAYKGRMNSDGMVNVKVGGEGFPPMPPAPPRPPAAPPAPPAPSAPPAPPAPHH
ncbi:MAG TPA: DUF2807 domain-containing protein [Rhizomicrobium sp.]|jgi:hypothetical protein